jgi:hypothetical protein
LKDEHGRIRDEWPGRSGSARVAEQLQAGGATNVRIVLQPDGGKDIREWLAAQRRGIYTADLPAAVLGRLYVNGLSRRVVRSLPMVESTEKIDALLSIVHAMQPDTADIPLLPPGTPTPAGSDGAAAYTKPKTKTRAIKPDRTKAEECFLRHPQKYHPKSAHMKHGSAPCDCKYHLPCWMHRKRSYLERTEAMARQAAANGATLYINRSMADDADRIRKQLQRLRDDGFEAEYLKVNRHTGEIIHFGTAALIGAEEVSLDTYLAVLKDVMGTLVQLPSKQRELKLSKGWDFPREEIPPDPDHIHLRHSQLTHEERMATYRHFGIEPAGLTEDGGNVDLSTLPQDKLRPLFEALESRKALPHSCECHVCQKWRALLENVTFPSREAAAAALRRHLTTWI